MGLFQQDDRYGQDDRKAKMSLFTLKDFHITNKKVLVRVDFNVPLNEKGLVLNDSRIRKSLDTLNYLIKHKARIILMSHLGRPKGKVIPKLKMNKVAERLSEILKKDVMKFHDTVGPGMVKNTHKLAAGDIMLLENLRFYEEETKDSKAFAKELASLADFYVNDAFGASHRAHSSVHAITRYIPGCAGPLLEKEINTLTLLLQEPKKPFIVILGGAKVSDKIGVINNLLKKADKILIGGAMMYTFLKAKGLDTGLSKVEDDQLKLAKKLLKNKKIILPTDCIIADRFDEDAKADSVKVEHIESNWLGLDIGPQTIKDFKKIIKEASTVFWNGPMGVFEFKKFAKGTDEIAKAVAASKAKTIIGGGESVEALEKLKLDHKIDHVSTGGGAALEFLEGKTLPAIEALEDSYKRFKDEI